MLKPLRQDQMTETVGGAISRTPAGMQPYNGSQHVTYVDDDGNVVCGYYPPKKKVIRIVGDALKSKPVLRP